MWAHPPLGRYSLTVTMEAMLWKWAGCLAGILWLSAVTLGLELCTTGSKSGDNTKLGVSTAKINGNNSKCYCRLSVTQSGVLSVFSLSGENKVIIQNCDASISIGGQQAVYCDEGRPRVPTGSPRNVSTATTLWIVGTSSEATTTGIKGALHFKPYRFDAKLGITIQCYEPNENGITTTPTPTPTPTITTTTTTTTPTPTSSVSPTPSMTTSRTTKSTTSGSTSTSKPDTGSTSKPNTGSTSTSKADTGSTSTSTSKPDTGSTSTSTPDTGSTTTSKPDTGSTATSTSKPDTGSTSTSKPDTGSTSTSTSKPDTGSTSTSKPDTRSTSTSKPDTGSTSTSTSKSDTGSTSTSTPATGSTTTSKPDTGSTSTSNTGSTSTSKPGKGSTTTSATATTTTTGGGGGGVSVSRTTSVYSTSSQTEKSPQTDKYSFPVAAVAGGVAGGLLLILIIAIAITCKRNKKEKNSLLLEDGEQKISPQRAYANMTYEEPQFMVENTAYESGMIEDRRVSLPNSDAPTAQPESDVSSSWSNTKEVPVGVVEQPDDVYAEVNKTKSQASLGTSSGQEFSPSTDYMSTDLM